MMVIMLQLLLLLLLLSPLLQLPAFGGRPRHYQNIMEDDQINQPYAGTYNNKNSNNNNNNITNNKFDQYKMPLQARVCAGCLFF